MSDSLFDKLSKKREKIIRKSSSKPIETHDSIFELANRLHPEEQHVKVDEIIRENDDVKTFVLVPDEGSGTKQLAYFKAGQYVSVCVSIHDGIYKRPYTLSCSPKMALQNKYTITIKREVEGTVSNFFLDEVEVGDTFLISEPLGNFYYVGLRDAKHVIAIAEDIGIVPFASMAEAIYDGVLDFSLTILYNAKTKNDLIFREKLEDITCKLENVNLVYILSEEDDNEFLKGPVDKSIIESYMKEENSFFVCGSVPFYAHMNDVLKEFQLPNKFIRHEAFMGEMELKDEAEYNLTVITQNEELKMKCNSRKTLLQTMEENGVVTLSHCHVGECGFCRSKLISGKVKTFDENIRAADKNHNYIHPCVTFPESDVILQLPI